MKVKLDNMGSFGVTSFSIFKIQITKLFEAVTKIVFVFHGFDF